MTDRSTEVATGDSKSHLADPAPFGNAAEGASSIDRRSISQTLDRGLAVIEAVADAPNGVTVSEVVQSISISRTVVVRLLNTLMNRNYITKDQTGKYFLATRTLELTKNVQPQLRSAARPVLQKLADQIGATAHLTGAENNEAVSVLAVEPRTATYYVAYSAGTRRPLTRGASGLAILSTRAPSSDELPEVTEARRRGWAFSLNQLGSGTFGVAAPLLRPQNVGLSVGVVLFGEPSEPQTIAEAVIEAAWQISHAFGS